MIRLHPSALTPIFASATAPRQPLVLNPPPHLPPRPQSHLPLHLLHLPHPPHQLLQRLFRLASQQRSRLPYLLLRPRSNLRSSSTSPPQTNGSPPTYTNS